MMPGEAEPAPVEDRGRIGTGRQLSIQSRLSNALALCLMLILGVAFLLWYYSRIANRGHARESSAARLERTQAEFALPGLGKLEIPAIEELPAPIMPAVQVLPSPVNEPAGLGVAAAPTRPSVLERRLSGAAFTSNAPPTLITTNPGPHDTQGLAALLMSDPARPASAHLLPAQRLLLPKGAFIDCTLETAIDSTLPGLTTCVTATDTFGADGSVVLLERGTKLLGQTRGEVQQASSRVFVLWTEARTPTGVIVPLDSPGADALGRSGLPGEVERHFWQRFGAAILISTLDGAIQAAVQSSGRGNGTAIYSPSGPQDVLSEVLKSTLSTQPTVIKRNGDRIEVLVARDVDFSAVYELRHVSDKP